MVTGVAMTLVGVNLVILIKPGATFSLSSDELLGSSAALIAAILFALFGIMIKPLVDRYGGMPIAIWSHWIAWAGLSLIAIPDLIDLTANDFPIKVIPNLLYSGLIANALGFIVYNHAIKILGPTQVSMYENFTPIITAITGILFLEESFTLILVVGTSLILWGVIIVRRNAQIYG